MYWVLYIVGRDIRGRTNYTCSKLHITFTCIPWFEGLCVRFSPAGSSISVVGTVE